MPLISAPGAFPFPGRNTLVFYRCFALQSGACKLYWYCALVFPRGSDGALLSRKLYKPWGELRAGTDETGFQFTGQRWEESIGLYDYKAHWYDPYITQFTQPDTVIPDPYNPLDWNRYAYGRNNPSRYTDPTGHFSKDQLREWYGDNWKQVIVEKYSEEMVLLLTQAVFGDMVTYEIRGKTFGAVFVQGEAGNLVAWDVSSKSCTTIENIDKNSISGFYTRDKDSFTEYSLDTGFSENAKAHVSLPGDWRTGNKNYVGTRGEMSIEPPSLLGWIGIVTGGVTLAIPGGPMIATVLGYVGFGAGVVDMVKVETGDAVYDYWMPHNPVPGEPNSPQWMGPPVYGTPEPPVPLY